MNQRWEKLDLEQAGSGNTTEIFTLALYFTSPVAARGEERVAPPLVWTFKLVCGSHNESLKVPL